MCIANAPPIENPPVVQSLQLLTLSGERTELLELGYLTNYNATFRDASLDYLLNEVSDILSCGL